MICPNCKTSNADTNTACTKCGASLNNAAPQKKKLSGGAKVAIALGSVGVLGVLAAIVVVILIVVLIFAVPALMKATKEKVPEVSVQGGQIEEENDLPEEELLPEENEEKEVEVQPADPVVEPEPLSPEVVSSYRLMNVTSNLGLNVRAQPNTASQILAVLIQDRHVFVEKIENNWAYVDCGYVKGWCSAEYLEVVPFQGTTVYRQDQIEEAKAAANEIIDSFYGKTPTGGRTDITVENAIAYFESCSNLYAFEASFGSQFEKLIPIAADDECAYYFVEDSKIKTVEDLCNKYFACFSDDIAAACLKGKVLFLDGRLAVAFRSDCFNGYYVSHTYDVRQESPSWVGITVTVKEYDPGMLVRDSAGKAFPSSPINENVYYFPCVIEDGVWVFETMDALFD